MRSIVLLKWTRIDLAVQLQQKDKIGNRVVGFSRVTMATSMDCRARRRSSEQLPLHDQKSGNQCRAVVHEKEMYAKLRSESTCTNDVCRMQQCNIHQVLCVCAYSDTHPSLHCLFNVYMGRRNFNKQAWPAPCTYLMLPLLLSITTTNAQCTHTMIVHDY
jgi:hypothetical protein